MTIYEITMISGAKHYVTKAKLEYIMNTTSEISCFVDVKTHEEITIFIDKIESFKEYKYENNLYSLRRRVYS